MPNKRLCSTCNNPAKGHVGPTGRKCTMLEDKSDFDAALEFTDGTTPQNPTKSKSSEKCSHYNAPRAQDKLVLELANQVANLSAKVDDLSSQISRKQKPKSKVVHKNLNSDYSSSDSDSSSNSSQLEDNTICLANGARVKKSKIKYAQRGEYANLNDFLPTTNLPAQSASEQSDVRKRDLAKGKLHISDYFSWSCAFAGYEEAILSAHPENWKELLQYKLYILDFELRYKWSAVYMYDLKFRAKMATKLSFKFGHIDSDTMLSVLTPDSIKDSAKVCFRCKGPFHIASECFFRKEYKMEKNPQEGQTASKSARPKGRQFSQYRGETCVNWNRGVCNFGDRCYRIHRCSGCGGRFPKYQCNSCSTPTPGTGYFPTGPPVIPPPSNFTGYPVNNFPAQPPGMGRAHGNTP